MSETPTAEKRAQWRRDIGPYLGKQGHGQSQIISQLLDEVERLETEVASVRLAGVVCLERAETKLGDVVARLRQTRDWSVAIRALDSWHEHGQAKCDCPGHKRIEKLRKNLKKMEDTFLAGLSTVTEESHTKPTTAAKRTDAIIIQQQGERIDRLLTDVEALEKDAKRIDLGWKAELAVLRDQNERDKAQLDEVVENLEVIAKITGAENVEKMLAGIRTATRDGESAVRQPERSIGGGNGELC